MDSEIDSPKKIRRLRSKITLKNNEAGYDKSLKKAHSPKKGPKIVKISLKGLIKSEPLSYLQENVA